MTNNGFKHTCVLFDNLPVKIPVTSKTICPTKPICLLS